MRRIGIPVCALVIAVFSAFLSSCSDRFEYRGLNEFVITDSVIMQGDKVSVLYCSGGPEKERDKPEFYYHLLVRSAATGKTINLLSPTMPDLKTEEELFVLLDRSEVNKVLSATGSDTAWQQLTKVVRNRHYLEIEDNKFATQVGMLNPVKK